MLALHLHNLFEGDNRIAYALLSNYVGCFLLGYACVVGWFESLCWSNLQPSGMPKNVTATPKNVSGRKAQRMIQGASTGR